VAILSQTSKNAMLLLLSLMFSPQQNQKTRGQNKFCGVGVGGKLTQIMYTHVSKWKNNNKKKEHVK
jgi:hypothetical protein